MKTKTGVFFHPSFSGEEWIIIGDKFRNFPSAMEHISKSSTRLRFGRAIVRCRLLAELKFSPVSAIIFPAESLCNFP